MLNRVVMESFTEKLAHEHRPEGNLGASHVDIFRWFRADIRKCQGPEAEVRPVCLGHAVGF